MELFALLPDADGLRARFILHLSDFTADGSPELDQLDQALLKQCVAPRPRIERRQPLPVESRHVRRERPRLRRDPRLPLTPARCAPSAASTSPT